MDAIQRDTHELIAGILSHTGRPVCGPTEGTKQAEFIGRKLLIIQNDVTEQWQSAGSVVR